MILQTDPRLRPEINEYGCYMMSILYLAEKNGGESPGAELINSLYDRFVRMGLMTASCKILNPEHIFAYMGLIVEYTDKHELPTRECGPDELEILKFTRPGYSHFVAGDGAGGVEYDPMGESITVRDGVLQSKRIFKMA
jgi:hypothetical protein